MKPLEFVRTPGGQLAIIQETNGAGREASIEFIGPSNGERNAWWGKDELTVVDSLPSLIARMTAHPFGIGREDADRYYPGPLVSGKAQGL